MHWRCSSTEPWSSSPRGTPRRRRHRRLDGSTDVHGRVQFSPANPTAWQLRFLIRSFSLLRAISLAPFFASHLTAVRCPRVHFGPPYAIVFFFSSREKKDPRERSKCTRVCPIFIYIHPSLRLSLKNITALKHYYNYTKVFMILHSFSSSLASSSFSFTKFQFSAKVSLFIVSYFKFCNICFSLLLSCNNHFLGDLTKYVLCFVLL